MINIDYKGKVVLITGMSVSRLGMGRTRVGLTLKVGDEASV